MFYILQIPASRIFSYNHTNDYRVFYCLRRFSIQKVFSKKNKAGLKQTNPADAVNRHADFALSIGNLQFSLLHESIDS
jgi:hypothetical protein